jgi:hypothetical protein
MKNLWKYSGSYLTWTGIIHTAFALWTFRDNFWNILKNGVVNQGGQGPEFWFLLLGPLLMLFGPLLQHYLRETGLPAPRWFGWWLLVLSVVGCALYPASGFWLFVPQAVIIIAAKIPQRTKR